jgi:hypothetical protein
MDRSTLILLNGCVSNGGGVEYCCVYMGLIDKLGWGGWGIAFNDSCVCDWKWARCKYCVLYPVNKLGWETMVSEL